MDKIDFARDHIVVDHLLGGGFKKGAARRARKSPNTSIVIGARLGLPMAFWKLGGADVAGAAYAAAGVDGLACCFATVTDARAQIAINAKNLNRRTGSDFTRPLLGVCWTAHCNPKTRSSVSIDVGAGARLSNGGGFFRWEADAIRSGQGKPSGAILWKKLR